MIVYFISAIIASLLMLKYDKYKKKSYLFFSFLLLFCISGFRYGIGLDYFKIYVPIFNSILNGATVEWEIGAVLISKIIGFFTTDYLYFFIVTSFITMLFFYKGILKLSDAPALCLLLFVVSGEYINSFNAVRQYIALSIFIYSIRFILESKFLKYFLYILLASAFHSSSLILVFCYFLPKLNLGIKKQFLLIIASIIFLPFLSDLFFKILSLTRYSVYLNSDYNVFDPSYSELIMAIIVYLISLFFYNDNKNDKKFMLFYNFITIYLIIAILSFRVLLAFRLVIYFRIFQIFMLSHISTKILSSKKRLYFNILIIMFFSSITLIGGYLFGWYNVDYISIFNRE